MATTIRLHGGLPDGIRDHHGVFGRPSTDMPPQARLAEAQNKAAELKRKHAEAQSTLRAAVEDDGDHYDFQALKSNVHRLARELTEAEEQVTTWQRVCAAVEQSERSARFDEALREARAARKKFAELYRDACLQLGKWYSLGTEVRELANKLANRLPNGTVYYLPELKDVLQEVNENPNPLHQLLDNGYSELQTSASWRRHIAFVPMIKKGERGR